MSCDLQLQRNSKVFFSTIDLDGGAAAATMTARNTFEVEILAGYAVSQATATQDVQPLESGTTPDRSSTRFNTALNPVEWSFQTYIRPTGVDDTDNASDGANTSNSKPLADWFMWQALISNTAPAAATVEQSVWQDNGSFNTADRSTAANVFPHTSNMGQAQTNYLYIKMDNVVYQISSAAVNEATVDAAIDSIAMISWSGFAWIKLDTFRLSLRVSGRAFEQKACPTLN